jgi:phosphoribosylglycinamide formyltransferase-1
MTVVVLISGNGSNLQAMIDAKLPIAAVISNESDAYGLTRAAQAGIPTHIIIHRNHTDRTAFDHALMQCIDSYHPSLIALAGFMRILGTDFVEHYTGRLINIHPSLLPAYKGCNTHQRVLESGETMHGTSVHFVTAELDGGPIIAQSQLAIEPTDTPDSLKARIQQLEHRLYPRVIQLILSGHLLWQQREIKLNGTPLEKNGIMLNL